jgi:hypothetical protein
MFHALWDNVIKGAAPGWVTVTLCIIVPAGLWTVIIPSRGDVDGFADAFIQNSPLLFIFDGFIPVIQSQLTLLDGVDHVAFLTVTPILVLPPATGAVHGVV